MKSAIFYDKGRLAHYLLQVNVITRVYFEQVFYVLNKYTSLQTKHKFRVGMKVNITFKANFILPTTHIFNLLTFAL